jgi:class 3 adenylate cyclase
MNKKIAAVIIAIVWTLSLAGQTFQVSVEKSQEQLEKTTDSLEKKLANTPDSLKWEVLYELSQNYREYSKKDSIAMQKGMMYSQQAEQMAMAANDTLQLLKSLSPLVYFYKRNDSMKVDAKVKSDLRKKLLLEWGYTIPSGFSDWEGGGKQSLSGRFRVFYDSTSTLNIENIHQRMSDTNRVSFSLKDKDLNDLPGTWWLRFRLRNREDHWQEHVFFTGEDGNYWDTVEVYTPDPEVGFVSRTTGAAIEANEWDVKDRPNHFRVSIPAHDDILVYVKLKDFPEGHAPEKLSIYHINYEAYLRDRVKTRHANGIFQGIVLIQLFFFFLYFLATRDPVYGNYAIYILGLSIFMITVNYFENIDDLVQASIYLSSVWLSTMGMLMFSHSYLNMKELMPRWRKPLIVFLIVFTFFSMVIAVLLPYMVDGITQGGIGILIPVLVGISSFIFFFLITAAVIFLPIWGIGTLRKGYEPAKYYLIATLFLFLGFLVPLGLSPFESELQELGILESVNVSTLIQGGIALQLCLFALGVGHKRNLLEKERREALEKNLAMQREINTATDRFVPYEFLKTLGRESILDVHLGDQVEKNVTVFFSDIRDYTTLSEQLTPQQNFIFLNNYLGRVGPIIKTNRGFVNQYYGDGIMALFMGTENGINSPKDSVLAALEMHKELFQYNLERKEKDRNPIRIGIGIHSGPLMLGVIGDEKRMDVGVVSDTVNTAARMEGLTKFYGSSTIVSGATFNGIAETDGLHYRYLGQVLVKGKKEPIKIYDFFDGDSEEIALKKESSLSIFQQGLDAYFARDFKASIKAFNDVLHIFPGDKASLYYLDKAKMYLQSGVSDDWTGVEIIVRK